MKNQIINEIQRKMLPYLNNEQLLHLKAVLEVSFQGVIIEMGEEQPKAEEQDSVAAFITAKRIEGCSEKTLTYYSKTIAAMLNGVGKSPQQITTDDLRRYLTDYQTQRHSSKVTIDNIRRILSSFFSWLEDEDFIMKSPVRRIHKVKTAKIIKETYTDEALELMRDNCSTVRDLVIIDLLASSGMRVGELVTLNREDINFNERECVVFGKGNKERLVYFDARTKIHLQNYLDERSDSNPALFVTLKEPHERLMIGGVETMLRELGRRLKLNKVHADADKNDFYVVNQYTFVENGNNRRPDIILFINGLPLVLIELKSPSKDEVGAENAYNQIRNYMKDIPSMFYYNAICVISDLSTNKAGTITSGLDRFMEWKTKDGDYENTAYAQFDTFYEGMFQKARLLDILKNFILFSGDGQKPIKILAGYHQYFAVRKAIEKAKIATKTDGKGGVFWHTQGSGKSLSMVFYAHLLQEALDSPTIVVMTDRIDLDDAG